MSRVRYKGSAACPRVSDHAVLRYLERVKGLDIEKIRSEILTPDIAAAIRAGATAVTISGARFPVRGGVIVTVIGDEFARSRRGRASEEAGR